MLKGELSFTTGDDGSRVTVGEGDALVLSVGSTWSWENPGAVEAHALWVEQLPPGAWNGYENKASQPYWRSTEPESGSESSITRRGWLPGEPLG
jgi:hypothetical protein